MRTINVGDCYILHDVIHGKFTVQQNKALHYAFGTLSGRPVVVIRAPAKWDHFGMITVIPAMSKGDPAFEVGIEDIFGKEVQCNHSTYKWVPHYPYTVPVSRLGKYIGSLTIPEMKELIDAFEWVHNPFRQMTEPAPKVYENIATLGDRSPNEQIAQSVNLDHDFKMQTLDEFNGLAPKVDGNDINPKFLSVVKHHIPEILQESAVESTETPEETEKKDNTVEEPVQLEIATTSTEEPVKEEVNKQVTEYHVKRFSMTDKIEDFIRSTVGDQDILHEIYMRGKFSFNESDVFNLMNKPKRTRFDTTGLPLNLEFIGVSPEAEFTVWNTFDKLSVADIWLIIPNLGTREVCKVYHRNLQVSRLLREVCKAAKKLTNTEYSTRKQLHEVRADETTQTEISVEHKTVETAMPYTTESDPEVIEQYLMELKPFLTYNQIGYLPSSLYKKFLAVPMYRIQRVYQGKKFLEKYKETLQDIASA